MKRKQIPLSMAAKALVISKPATIHQLRLSISITQ